MTDNELFEKQVALGWQALSPPEGLKERVRVRVTSPASPWQALRASGALGVSVGALLVGLGFGAGYGAQSARLVEAPPSVVEAPQSVVEAPPSVVEAPPSVVEAPKAVVEAPASEPPLDRVEVEAAPSSRPAELPEPAAPAQIATTKPRPSQEQALESAREDLSALEETRNEADGGELGLIQRAERAIRAKNPELALALSAELTERYPHSELHEERRSILLMARCQTGATDTAAEREQLAEQYPGSVYTERIASECRHAQPSSP